MGFPLRTSAPSGAPVDAGLGPWAPPRPGGVRRSPRPLHRHAGTRHRRFGVDGARPPVATRPRDLPGPRAGLARGGPAAGAGPFRPVSGPLGTGGRRPRWRRGLGRPGLRGPHGLRPPAATGPGGGGPCSPGSGWPGRSSSVSGPWSRGRTWFGWPVAYDRVRPSLPEPWPLVMVGPSGWGAQVQPHGGGGEAGIVTPAELAGLYARARLLAYVPLMEGFGLPPVEAIWRGHRWWRATSRAADPLPIRSILSTPTRSPRACWWWPPTMPAASDCSRPGGSGLPSSAGRPSLGGTWTSGRRSAMGEVGSAPGFDRPPAAAPRVTGASEQPTRKPDPVALTLDVSAVPADPVGAGQYTLCLASALAPAARLGPDPDQPPERPGTVGRPRRAPPVPAAPRRRPLRLAWERGPARPGAPARCLGPPRSSLHDARTDSSVPPW